MSIRSAVAWLFDVGNGSEADAGPSGVRRGDTRPHETVEGHLYGQAEAIRVLYQTVPQKERPPKPPRAKRDRGLWVARYVDSLSASLADPVETEA
jgi:hypothetical protein